MPGWVICFELTTGWPVQEVILRIGNEHLKLALPHFWYKSIEPDYLAILFLIGVYQFIRHRLSLRWNGWIPHETIDLNASAN